MNFTTFCNKNYISYELYIEQPKQMVEIEFLMIIDENPQSITALDRSVYHLLIRKHTYTT